MPSSYKLLKAALERVERARIAPQLGEPLFYVTQLASGGRGRGRGVEEGRRVHKLIWGLDPYDVLNAEELATPLPLAWRFRFGWVLGVADLVAFKRGVPVSVVEVKSYPLVKRSERVQASLYGLLVMLNFCVKPRVLVVADGVEEEVRDWELLALEALQS